MSDQTTDPNAAAAEKTAAEKAAKAAAAKAAKEAKAAADAEITKAVDSSLIRLQHEHRGNWTLSIGTHDYAVVDGVVEVEPWHLDAATQAGFRQA